MNEDGRFIPPGPGRIAAFARRGGHPEAYGALLGSGIGLLIAAALLYVLQDRAEEGVVALFRVGLDETRTGWIAPATVAERVLLPLFFFTAPVLFAVAAGIFFAAVLPAVASRRGRAVTAVPLPPLPKLRLTRFAVRSLGAAIAVFAALLIARKAFRAMDSGESPLESMGRALMQLTAATGAVLAALGAVERILIRHGIYRALFLNRSEHRRELRAQEGNREATARAARLRSREVNG